MPDLRLGQYIELVHFMQKDNGEAIGQLLASISYKPFGKNNSEKHKEIADYYQGRSIVETAGAAQRLTKEFSEFNLEYKGLFEIEDIQNDDDGYDDDEVVQQHETNSFSKYYGWIYSATLVADHEKITLEEAFKLPIRQALNDLSYLKAKQANDKKLLEQHAKNQ